MHEWLTYIYNVVMRKLFLSPLRTNCLAIWLENVFFFSYNFRIETHIVRLKIPLHALVTSLHLTHNVDQVFTITVTQSSLVTLLNKHGKCEETRLYCKPSQFNCDVKMKRQHQATETTTVRFKVTEKLYNDERMWKFFADI